MSSLSLAWFVLLPCSRHLTLFLAVFASVAALRCEHDTTMRQVARYFGFAQQVGLELGDHMPEGLRHTMAFVSSLVTMTLNLDQVSHLPPVSVRACHATLVVVVVVVIVHTRSDVLVRMYCTYICMYVLPCMGEGPTL